MHIPHTGLVRHVKLIKIFLCSCVLEKQTIIQSVQENTGTVYLLK
jgi:hypothetical protein